MGVFLPSICHEMTYELPAETLMTNGNGKQYAYKDRLITLAVGITSCSNTAQKKPGSQEYICVASDMAVTHEKEQRSLLQLAVPCNSAMHLTYCYWSHDTAAHMHRPCICVCAVPQLNLLSCRINDMCTACRHTCFSLCFS